MSKCRFWQNIDPGNPSPVEQAIEELQEDVQRLEEDIASNVGLLTSLRADVEKISYTEPVFGIFFDNDGNRDWTRLYRSDDGVTFRTVKQFTTAMRDPSMTRLGGKYLIAHTQYGANHDFAVSMSSDFDNWTTVYVNVHAPRVVGSADPNRQYGAVWAPQLVKIGSDVYYFISVEDTVTPTNGVLIPTQRLKTFHTYYGKVNLDSNGNITFDNCSLVNVNWNSVGSYIDADVCRVGSKYFMCVKNEATEKIEVYQANAINGTYNIVKIMPVVGVEGGSWFSDSDGQLWIYMDVYQASLNVPCYIRMNYNTGLAQCLLRDHKLRHGHILAMQELAIKYRNTRNTSAVAYSDVGNAGVEDSNWTVINNAGIQAIVPDVMWYIGKTGNLNLKIRNVTNADIRITQSTARSNDTLTLVQENSGDANITLTGSEYARYHTVSFAHSLDRTTKFFMSKG